MSKDLIYKTEQIKQLSIIKTISECLTLIVTNDGIKEHNPNGQKFLIILIEY